MVCFTLYMLSDLSCKKPGRRFGGGGGPSLFPPKGACPAINGHASIGGRPSTYKLVVSRERL